MEYYKETQTNIKSFSKYRQLIDLISKQFPLKVKHVKQHSFNQTQQLLPNVMHEFKNRFVKENLL